jgi:hypothetical protein
LSNLAHFAEWHRIVARIGDGGSAIDLRLEGFEGLAIEAPELAGCLRLSGIKPPRPPSKFDRLWK